MWSDRPIYSHSELCNRHRLGSRSLSNHAAATAYSQVFGKLATWSLRYRWSLKLRLPPDYDKASNRQPPRRSGRRRYIGCRPGQTVSVRRLDFRPAGKSPPLVRKTSRCRSQAAKPPAIVAGFRRSTRSSASTAWSTSGLPLPARQQDDQREFHPSYPTGIDYGGWARTPQGEDQSETLAHGGVITRTYRSD